METPRTPPKHAGINKIVDDINTRWGLDIPVREVPTSPSKDALKGTTEGTILKQIQILYWRDRVALDRALESFNIHATQILSEWVFKEHADSDCLPRRHPSSLDASQLLVLKEELARLLGPIVSERVEMPRSIFPRLELRTKAGDFSQQDGASDARVPISDEFSSQFEVDDFFLAEKQGDVLKDDTEQRRRSTTASTDMTGEHYFTPSPDNAERRSSLTVFSSNLEPLHVTQVESSKSRKRLSRDGEEDVGSPRKWSRIRIGNDPPVIRNSQPVSLSRASSHGSLSTAFSNAATPMITPTASFGPTTANTSFSSSNSGSANHAKRNLEIAALLNNPRSDQASSVEAPAMQRSLSDPSSTGREFDICGYINRTLYSKTPFPPSLPYHKQRFSFRMVYEIFRAALQTDTEVASIFDEFTRRKMFDESDYGEVCSVLSQFLHRDGKRLPERSTGWDKATGKFLNVCLSGKLEVNKGPTDRLLRLNLLPLKVEPTTCRLSRKFQGDRLLVINLPVRSFEPANLPDVLAKHGPQARLLILQWLQKPHQFLGRRWQCFFGKQDRLKTRYQKEYTPTCRLYFFALDEGKESNPSKGALKNDDQIQISHGKDLLDWALEPHLNKAQSIYKLYSRMQLVLSATNATLEFAPTQIILRDNAYSDSPGAWRLDVKRSHEKKRNPGSKPPKKAGVMGCARISRKAAEYVAESLRLDYVPSAFQGRIAGAKGIWIVDTTGEELKSLFGGNVFEAKNDPGVWIEVTDEQRKFDVNYNRPSYLTGKIDSSKLTLEVLAYSKPLKPGNLNIQTILVCLSQGVPCSAFHRLLMETITTEAELLKTAMADPRKLSAYVQSRSPIRGARLAAQGIDMVGGLPYARTERLLWLLNSGFSSENEMVVELCREQLKQQHSRLIEKMNIPIKRSTLAFIVPDPLDVLEEDECFLRFSSPFSETQEIMLHDVEVLVARSPVMQPSDIKKVRAVFKPQLLPYKDVIIFSSRGPTPLASQLSGGDYDGSSSSAVVLDVQLIGNRDKVWICWDPEIVKAFVNYSGNYQPKSESFFGITKHGTTLSDLETEPGIDPVTEFFRRGLDFNMKEPLVSQISTYHESFVYDLAVRCGKMKDALSDHRAMDLACAFSHLIDAAKSGIEYSREEWRKYLARRDQRQFLPPPAYKRPDDRRLEKRLHPVDGLVYDAQKVANDVLKDFAEHRKSLGSSTYDADLAAVAEAEHEHSKADPELKAVLLDLQGQLSQLYNDWSRRMTQFRTQNESEEQFRTIANLYRNRFLAIRPFSNTNCDMAKRWEKEGDGACCLATRGSWVRLKASFLFSMNHRRGIGYWWICGHELGIIKAESTKNYFPVIGRMYDVMKVDTKLVEQLEFMRPLENDVNEEEDLFGEEDDDDDRGMADWETAFESFDEERR